MKNFTLILFSLFLTITSYGQALVISVDVCEAASNVQMTGPFWGWSQDSYELPAATIDEQGFWVFTFDTPPTVEMEYLIISDGVQENLIQAMVDGGTCAPVTDYYSYANRIWDPSDNNLYVYDVTYGQCTDCATTGTPNSLKSEGAVSVFPNPATNYLNVSTTTDFKRLNIVNIYGSVVKDFRLIGNFNVLDLNGIAPGIYLVNAFSQDGVFTKQITVK